MSIMQSQQTYSEVGTQVRMPRVNLLPPEILEGRRLRRTKGALAGGLVVVAAGLVGVYALQVNAKSDAQHELDAARGEHTTLVQEQAKYADVPRTIKAIDAAETTRELAMANDVEWYRTLTNFSLTQPSNVWLTKLSLDVVAPAAPTISGAAPSGVAPTANVGTVTVEGSAMDHPDVATWLDTLANQPGMADAYFSSSEKAVIGSKVVVDFKSTATLTSESLSHRYDRKQG